MNDDAHGQEWTEAQIIVEAQKALDQIVSGAARVRHALDTSSYVEADAWGDVMRETCEALDDYLGELSASVINDELDGSAPHPMRVWRNGEWLTPSEARQ